MNFADSPSLTCFIMTPFADEFLPVSTTLKTVLASRQGRAFRADDIRDPGLLLDQITRGIEQADFCVADATKTNPNVLWEAGYAHALGRPIVQISQGVAHLPFDIRAYRTLLYSAEDLPGLERDFAAAVDAVVQLLKSRPRVLGKSYDELLHLAMMLSRRSVYPTRFESVLPVVEEALSNERRTGNVADWQSDEAERLMRAIARVNSSYASNAFWWLIVHGVFVYPGIEGPFQNPDDDGEPLDRWQDNIDLVSISQRGVRLLNQLKNPIAVQAQAALDS